MQRVFHLRLWRTQGIQNSAGGLAQSQGFRVLSVVSLDSLSAALSASQA